MTEPVGNGGTEFNRADQHKHMEFVQAIVARLANNSFLMKGWALTVSAAILGYAISHFNWGVALLGLLPVLAFWFLDSYYLRQERMFRCLHRDVAAGVVRDFDLSPKSYEDEVSWLRTARSVSLWPFYGSLLMAALLVLVIATQHKQPAEHPGPHPWHRHSKAL